MENQVKRCKLETSANINVLDNFVILTSFFLVQDKIEADLFNTEVIEMVLYLFVEASPVCDSSKVAFYMKVVDVSLQFVCLYFVHEWVPAVTCFQALEHIQKEWLLKCS